jgi:hypothetical protein
MRKYLALIVSLLFAIHARSQTNTYTGASGGNWGTATNWSLGIVPTAAHDVVVPNNINIVVDVSTANCSTLTIQTGANSNRIDVGANTLTVANAITINIPTANNTIKQVYVTSGTLNAGSIVMGNSATNTRDCRIVVENGVINVSGNITMGGTSAENQTQILGTALAGGTLNLGGSFVGSGGDLICNNNSTVRYNGTGAQTVSMTMAFNYNNLIIDKPSGVATLSANITAARVSGNLTVQQGVFNASTFTITGNASRTFKLAADTVFRTSASGGSAAPSGFGTFDLASSSTFIFERSGNQSVRNYASPGYGILTFSGSGNKTAAGNLFVQGDITVNSGVTFELSNRTHAFQGDLINNGAVTSTNGNTTISGNLENAGTFTAGNTSILTIVSNFENSGTFTAGTSTSNLNIGGSYNNTGTFTSGSSGTVTFNSTSAGNLIQGNLIGASGRFNNLVFNGINGEWTIDTDLLVNRALTITNGDVVATNNITVAGAFPISVAAGSLLTLENNANILQTGYTGVNSGNIEVKRNSTPLLLDDFTYWSAPAIGTQTLQQFSPNSQGDRFYTFSGSWANASVSSPFSPGLGYAIRAPEDLSPIVPEIRTFTFEGVPNNGTYSQAVAVGDKLVGNPYPSAISANAFIDANLIGTGTVNQTISGKLFFWTHNNRLVGNDYLASDYAFYTKLGGTAVSSGTGNTNAPNGFIASGQGFFVEVSAAGNVTFNNSMRVANNNTNFYRAQALVENSGFDRFWLNLNNASSNVSQTLVGFCEGCTTAVDPGYDGTYTGSDAFVLYTWNGNTKYSIQALPPFTDTNIVVPIGYTVPTAGTTQVSLANTDGVFINSQDVFIEDLESGSIHNLANGPYVFTTEAGTFESRLRVRFTEAPLSNPDMIENDIQIKISSRDSEIAVSNPEKWDSLQIFDLLGKSLSYEILEENESYKRIRADISNQLVILKIQTKDGTVVTRKVLVP